jgi:hypothetical protein
LGRRIPVSFVTTTGAQLCILHQRASFSPSAMSRALAKPSTGPINQSSNVLSKAPAAPDMQVAPGQEGDTF